MNTYHKIQTVFKRDPDNNYKTLLLNEYSLPEFEYLKNNEWIFTEKVDGTNIRVMWQHNVDIRGSGAYLSRELKFGGKTDRAQIPADLVNKLNNMFSKETMEHHFPDVSVCLYGEGYGPKIQKGGGKYRDDVSFILFDVLIDDIWLERNNVEDIADKLNIDVVPIIGAGDLDLMLDVVKDGFRSQWGDFTAEGIVARPANELLRRNGERIITKLKHKDFNYE